MAIFSGLSTAYGVYKVDPKAPKVGDKAKGKALTVRGEVTLELWEKHVAGEEGLGIVPINENGECLWGVIDIDQYDLKIKDVIKKIKDLKLPLIVCRSKSGGAHVFLLFKEPLPAADVQVRLREIAAVLGFGSSEIFPKQITMDVERGDVGNWLNMPYFNAEQTTRYAIDEQGESLTLDEFLLYIENRRLSAEQFGNIKIDKPTESDLFPDGPCCLPVLFGEGVQQGERNVVLFNAGVYAKLSDPDDWEKKLEKINQAITDPLTAREMVETVRSLKRKKYQYQCSEGPLARHCNATLCRTRKYGVNPNDSMPVLSSLRKIDSDEPLWFLDIEGIGQLELNTTQLLNPGHLEAAAADQLNIVFPTIKKIEWKAMLQPLFDDLTIVEMSMEEMRDSSIRGRFEQLVEEFCTDQSQAHTKEELLLGMPYKDGDLILFRLIDLEEHLARRNFRDYTRTKVTRTLRDMGGFSKYVKIKGSKGSNIWMIPAFPEQKEPFEVPDMGQQDPF
jgi:hypothetical protein